MASDNADSDSGLVTIHMTGGGPYGFRLAAGDSGQLVVGKLRKRGRADEAGLQEGDVLLAVNGRSCQGLSCTQAMDLVDSAGSSVAMRVRRGGTRSSVNRTPSAAEQPTQQQQTSSLQSVSRSHSGVQERQGQTVYVPSTNPINAAELFAAGPSTTASSATVQYVSPPHQPADGLTVSAPAGVQVNREPGNSRTFTLTFGLDAAGPTDTSTVSTVTQKKTTTTSDGSSSISSTTITTTTTQQQQQLVWQPPKQQPPPKDETAAGGPRPPLARILQESMEQDPPGTPTSPGGRTKKMFIDSAFYDDPQHKYPTVEEQIALARRVAMSVLAPANVNSRGHKMFMRSRERSYRWEAGYNPDNEQAAGQAEQPQEMFFRADPWTGPGSGGPSAVSSPPPVDLPPLSASSLPLTSFVFAPKLPSGENVDKERLDALSSEELERVMMQEKKTTHTNIAPQVCFNLAEGLRNMKGRGGQLFAKRQAKAESWTVGGGEQTDGQPQSPPPVDDPTAISNASILLKETENAQAPTTGRNVSAMPVNRLKEMVDLPRPAMTPWEAAANYGTVDPAFAHLSGPSGSSAAVPRQRDSGGSTGSAGGGRVKSWAASNPEAAAGLAAAMTSSLQSRSITSDVTTTRTTMTSSSSSTGYQSVKFPVPSAAGTASDSDDQQRRLSAAVETNV